MKIEFITMAKINTKVQQLNKFLKEDIWHVNKFSGISKWKIWLYIQVRVVIVAIKGITQDKCMQKASALTYYSLLSIVPIFAMLFGIAKGFGFDKMLEDLLFEQFADKKEVLDQIMEFSKSFLENSQGGLIAGVGIIVLFWSVLKVMNNIEEAFNEIWEVKQNRSLIRKLSDYLTILIIAPIFFIVSNSATSYISAEISELAKEVAFYDTFGGIVTFGLQLLPLSLIWITLAIIYAVMPNTKVKFSSALIAGVIAGIAFQLTQYFYIKFQVGMARYNAIYGSFAALPLFLIWLQTSWLIILVGAEIAFASQNHREFEQQKSTNDISHSTRINIALTVLHAIVGAFIKGEGHLDKDKLSDKLKLPLRIVNMVLYDLSSAGIISETLNADDKPSGFLPAFDTNKMTITGVTAILEEHGSYKFELDHSKTYLSLVEKQAQIRNIIEEAGADTLISELADIETDPS